MQSLIRPASSQDGWWIMLKSHTCGELRLSHCDETVTLAGWVNVRRDHGGLIFLDLRDRFGITQVTVDSADAPEAHAAATQIRSEYVVRISGQVQRRPAGFENPAIATGEVEVVATEVEILNAALTPPFYIRDESDDTDETLRLQYRFLDLRRPGMMANLVLRHKIIAAIRGYLSERGFIEVETPHLLKSTPEGARDFVVPSRLQQGLFYALPQSPQQLKQLLMVAGLERYFQIARCFRDEDLRADRQLEFTQLDLEMSFVEPADIRDLMETMLIQLTDSLVDKRIRQVPFPILTYAECMERYGNDRPDLRFDLELFDATASVTDCAFRVFADAVGAGGQVKGVVYPGGCDLSRREIDALTRVVQTLGAKGLAWIGLRGDPTAADEVTDTVFRSQITRFLTLEELRGIVRASGAQTGDMLLLVADQPDVVAASLNLLRSEIAERAGLIDPDEFAYCWVTDFPLLERDAETGQLSAVHHPFTTARDEDWPKLESDPDGVLAKAYDVVLNGWELGGGSIRIHEADRQKRLFALLNLSEEEIQSQFGHMLRAFQYGAPPHGGIAMGLDRLVALFADTTNIREVIAFPKTATGADLMVDAPSPLSEEQLLELGIEVAVPLG